MVEAVRPGQSLRAVARQFRVSLHTVQRWVARAGDQPLEAVPWADRPPVAHTIHRTPVDVEEQLLALRQELRARSDLGEYGARAIHAALCARGAAQVPSVRTIGRILERRGALDGRRRLRRLPPPPGWYLPPVAAHQAEVDLVDGVEDLVLEGGFHLDVLTAVSLHGGLVGAWPAPPTLTTAAVLDALVAHWRQVGLPGYAQFDNDPRFTGANRYADVLGRVIRLCVSLQVVPVFAPPHETGFQAAVESFNARWPAKVWARFSHPSFQALCAASARYVAACRRQRAARLEAAPARRPFPARWRFERQAPPVGQLVYLRRTDARGRVSVLGRSVPVSSTWPHRLVRCEVDLQTQRLRVYALRRRQPDQQPLLREVSHAVRSASARLGVTRRR